MIALLISIVIGFAVGIAIAQIEKGMKKHKSNTRGTWCRRIKGE